MSTFLVYIQPSAQTFDEGPKELDNFSSIATSNSDNTTSNFPYSKSRNAAAEKKIGISDCQLIFNDNLILYGVKNKFATKWHYLKSLSALNFTEYLIDNNMHCNSTFCMYHDVCIHRVQEQATNHDFCKKGILSNLNTVIPIQ